MDTQQILNLQKATQLLVQEILAIANGNEGRALAILDRVSLMLLEHVRAPFNEKPTEKH
jgi:hypothetical protein